MSAADQIKIETVIKSLAGGTAEALLRPARTFLLTAEEDGIGKILLPVGVDPDPGASVSIPLDEIDGVNMVDIAFQYAEADSAAAIEKYDPAIGEVQFNGAGAWLPVSSMTLARVTITSLAVRVPALQTRALRALFVVGGAGA